jgi:hypothetical protein
VRRAVALAATQQRDERQRQHANCSLHPATSGAPAQRYRGRAPIQTQSMASRCHTPGQMAAADRQDVSEGTLMRVRPSRFDARCALRNSGGNRTGLELVSARCNAGRGRLVSWGTRVEG